MERPAGRGATRADSSLAAPNGSAASAARAGVSAANAALTVTGR